MDQRGSTTLIAPVVLGLFTLADILRPRFPDVRWHMFYPAMACGMVNGVSAEKAGAVTCMITGHRASTHSSRAMANARCDGNRINNTRYLTRLGLVATVMTLAGSVANFVQHGPSAKLRATFVHSGGVFACFAGSCAVMMKLWTIGVPPQLQLLSRWRCFLAGLAYFIVLVLHERPRKRLAK